MYGHAGANVIARLTGRKTRCLPWGCLWHTRFENIVVVHVRIKSISIAFSLNVIFRLLDAAIACSLILSNAASKPDLAKQKVVIEKTAGALTRYRR